MARIEFAAHDSIEGPIEGNMHDNLFQLGLMYCAGRDVRLDLVEAHKWFNLAALKGNAEAKRYRAEVAGELSKAEVARAQRLAREWLALH
jgi:hypothetical protein